MKFALRLAPALLLFSSLPALACQCQSSGDWVYPSEVLKDFVVEHYGKYATYTVDHEHEHHTAMDTFLWILDGKPEAQGGNCWYKNDLGEMIADCQSSITITYNVTVSLVAETCKQVVTIEGGDHGKKRISFEPAHCKED
jgi:hypothetical protein